MDESIGPAPQQSGRALARTIFIVVAVACATLANGIDLALPWHPFSTLGYSANNYGVITAVDRTAARAGLRVGDRIDVSRLRPVQRLKFVSYITAAPEGTLLALPVVSRAGDRIVHLTSHLRLRSGPDNVSDVVSVLMLALYALIAGALVLLRPLPATWAFFWFSYSFFTGPTIFTQYADGAVFTVKSAIAAVIGAMSSVFFVWFALRFPNARLSGPVKNFERALLFGIAPFMAAVGLAGVILALAGRGNGVTALTQSLIGVPLFFAGIAILVARYIRADTQNRNRLRWIVVSFAVAFLPTLVVSNIERSPLIGLLPPVWFINVAASWTVLAPIALTYTILKHRLFDTRFVLSRALIYGVTTALFVGIIALVDWAAGRWLAESKFAVLTELALALAVGVSLNAVHRRIETFLNGVIFRAQAKMLEAIRKFAHEVDLIHDPQRLLLQTFEALRTRLESDYVCIYAIDGGSYGLVKASGFLPSLLAADDFAVLHLRRWHEPFVCEEKDHPLHGALLLPMAVRNDLIGFIACGPKMDRTHYLPEEVQTLSDLTHRVGTAYGWLTVRPSALQVAPTWS